MLYTFALPQITDTKNLKKTFAKSQYVTKENRALLDDVNNQRKQQKLATKAILKYKSDENPADHLIQDFNKYANSSFQLMKIFDQDYKITKNFKWTPMFTQAKLLKFSKDIKFGKTGEIIMANWAAFAVQFMQVDSQATFIEKNIYHIEGESLQADVRFSSIKQRDPIVTKLEESATAMLRKYVDAWTSLKQNVQRLSSCFQIVCVYDDNIIETKGISTEIALGLVQINANALYIEVLRRRANWEDMGKYAKSIVTLADKILNYLRPYKNASIDLVLFLEASRRLYKSIALWSLFFPYSAKVKSQSYGPGENMNLLAGAASSFVDEIGKLHGEIKALPGLEKSRYNGPVMHYFTKVIVAKSSEIAKLYGELYRNVPYDDSHFSSIQEKDYVAENMRSPAGSPHRN